MSLLAAWRDFNVESGPFLMDGDEVLRPPTRLAVLHSSWETYIGEPSFGGGRDTRFHLGLVPIPFTGDLEKAKVVLLLLNPGLEPADYFGEFKVDGFRDRLVDNLRQDFSRTQYPFVYLDPAIAWHSGYRWWHGKFQGVIAGLAQSWAINYAEARLRFAKIMACVELVPYHSVSYGRSGNIRDRLNSVRLAREYVHKVLKPRSDAGEVLIVVTRQISAWGLEESGHIVKYEGSETRAAHLTPASRGGGRILKFLQESNLG